MVGKWTLMDYRMPGINGLEAAREILAQKPNIKIIMASAIMQAAKIGVIEVLENPFSMQKLVQIMKKHIQY